MLSPPDAEPVIAASTLTVIATDMTGSLVRLVMPSRTTAKAGSEAITPPYPTSEAVFNIGSIEPSVPLLIVSTAFRRRRRLATNANSVAQATASTIDQMPATAPTLMPPYLVDRAGGGLCDAV